MAGDEVPEYECREACIYGKYNWATWLTLDYRERAATVAQYRLHHLIEAHIQERSQQDSKRASAKSSQRRR